MNGTACRREEQAFKEYVSEKSFVKNSETR